MTTVRLYLNKFGNIIKMAVTAIVALLVAYNALKLYDAVRYDDMLFAFLAFVAGVTLVSNRWMTKIVSIVVLIVLGFIIGNEPDVKQIFIYFPYTLGAIAQFFVGLRINLVDKHAERHTEEH